MLMTKWSVPAIKSCRPWFHQLRIRSVASTTSLLSLKTTSLNDPMIHQPFHFTSIVQGEVRYGYCSPRKIQCNRSPRPWAFVAPGVRGCHRNERHLWKVWHWSLNSEVHIQAGWENKLLDTRKKKNNAMSVYSYGYGPRYNMDMEVQISIRYIKI